MAALSLSRSLQLTAAPGAVDFLAVDIDVNRAGAMIRVQILDLLCDSHDRHGVALRDALPIAAARRDDEAPALREVRTCHTEA